MFLNKCLLTTALALVITVPAMAANKPIPTIKPCTEARTSDCKVIPPLDPNQRSQARPQTEVQSQPQAQAQAQPVMPMPLQAQTPPPVGPVAVTPAAHRTANGIQIYIDKNGITIPGFLRVGPEGFRVGAIMVTNPNYHPPVPALGYAPSGPDSH